ncbi:hypothetical protein EB796_025119 [Bugula neritina]|uniref:HPGDS n=1 Tax=Bugula neritina TaxID=10212 RepID=A0A7J7IRW9_BUGNE|nr:hypothetical protein EB796_025119 [Bugula neritina]
MSHDLLKHLIMAQRDKHLYFDVRARGEAIRMLYALAGKELDDQRIGFADWPSLKPSTPLGKVPVLTTQDGVLCQSNVIARYLGRRFGLVGSTQWDETLNDLVMETVKEFYESGVIAKIFLWKIFKGVPEPEDPEKVLEEVRQSIIKHVNYIQSIAEGRGKKFILCDQIQLGDVWLYAALESSRVIYPDIMTITPWVKEFTAKFEADERMKKHMAERPPSAAGI